MDRLKSKKFWVLVLTLVITIVGGGGIDPALLSDMQLDPLAMGIAGLVSATYIIVQGRVDRANVLAKAAQGLDLEKVKELLQELTSSNRQTQPPPDDDFPY